jgi:hypothetical protein
MYSICGGSHALQTEHMRDLRKEANDTESADLQKNRSSWTNQLAQYRIPARTKAGLEQTTKGPECMQQKSP